MGFFGNVLSSVVKVAITPVAIIADAVDVVKGDYAENTKNLINSAVEDAGEAFDDLIDGDL